MIEVFFPAILVCLNIDQTNCQVFNGRYFETHAECMADIDLQGIPFVTARNPNAQIVSADCFSLNGEFDSTLAEEPEEEAEEL